MADDSQSVIIRDPEILSGEPVFRGTRVKIFWTTWKAEKRLTSS